MRSFKFLQLILIILGLNFCNKKLFAAGHSFNDARIMIVKMGVKDQQLSDEWKAAITSRMNKNTLDSFAAVKRELTNEEIDWIKLIESKMILWNKYRDSLAIPFRDIRIPDTVYVLLGFLGNDDGFTFEKQTVCLDVTALYRAYGKADAGENDSRINRIFAHEYTHLLHKAWARKTGYAPKTFMDEILWECIYEGIGMYRSLNPKWWPVNDTIPTVTQTALNVLYPVFTERIIVIKRNSSLTDLEKQKIQANLSRGEVNKKWGAFPVAIWLFREANGNEKNLADWLDTGPAAVIELAKKYLPFELRDKLSQTHTGSR